MFLPQVYRRCFQHILELYFKMEVWELNIKIKNWNTIFCYLMFENNLPHTQNPIKNYKLSTLF